MTDNDIIITKIGIPKTDTTIIENSPIHLESGKITGIFGRTGSGKSTLLRAIVCQIIDKKNYSYIDDLEISIDFKNFKSNNIKVAFIEQSPKDNLITRTVSDELILSYECAGCDEEECKKILSTLKDEFNIDHLFDRSTLELSEGEIQKVALYEAVGRKCELMVLDEPTAHLDGKSKENFGKILKKIILHNENCKIIVASHDSNFLKLIADRVYIIKNHKLVETDLNYLTEQTSTIKFNQSMKKENILIEVQDLSYHRGKNEILRKVSFKLCEGERLLIRGPNGAGKSTLLKLIAGLIKKGYEGSIKISDRNIKNLNHIWPNVIYLSMQEPNEQILSPTVQAEFNLNSLFCGKQDISEFIQILDEWGILLNDFTSTLSYGQKKILSLIPIVNKPKLLLLDGPFVGLDSELKQRFVNTLESFEGITTIVTSHEEGEWESWSTQILDIAGVKNGV